MKPRATQRNLQPFQLPKLRPQVQAADRRTTREQNPFDIKLFAQHAWQNLRHVGFFLCFVVPAVRKARSPRLQAFWFAVRPTQEKTSWHSFDRITASPGWSRLATCVEQRWVPRYIWLQLACRRLQKIRQQNNCPPTIRFWKRFSKHMSVVESSQITFVCPHIHAWG